MTTVTCAACKKETQVPFKPTDDRPVYCKPCFMEKRKAGGGARGGPRGRGRNAAPPKKRRWRRSEYWGYDPELHAPDQF